jgi:hypothetical protein
MATQKTGSNFETINWISAENQRAIQLIVDSMMLKHTANQ